jgi:sporulation protein YlmC with PRC-barrel domain
MLHNLTDLKGSTINARDGEIGEVEDFYFDDEKWAIRYLVVSTGSWLSGRRVLISPISVGEADRANRMINVNLQQTPSREQSRNRHRQTGFAPIRNDIFQLLWLPILLGRSLPVGTDGRAGCDAAANAFKY